MSHNKKLSLSPKTDLAADDPWFSNYKELLDGYLADPAIHNIVIAGKKGAGKSSILRSYNNIVYKKQTFLNISLREFKKTADILGKDIEPSQKKIEYFILQQILSRCSNADLRGAGIRGIPSKPRNPSLLICAVIFLSVLFFYFLQNFEILNNAVSILELSLISSTDIIKWQVAAHIFLSLMLACFIVFLCRRLWNMLQMMNVKVKTPNVEMELKPSPEKYSLDQYHDNLILILENLSSKINYTIVIEDLDENLGSEVCCNVIEKLLSLNKAINDHMAEHDNIVNLLSIRKLWSRIKEWILHPSFRNPLRCPPMRFIYAMDDETIPHQEQVSMFNCCIPVNSPLNPDTSHNIIDGILLQRNFDIDCEDMQNVLNIISSALTNYRHVNHIINELEDLKKTLNKNYPENISPQNDAVLLAIAFYKFMFEGEYRIACSQSGDDRFPTPDSKNPNAAVAVQLRDAGYLDSKILAQLNSYPINSNQSKLVALTEGSSKQKERLLNQLLIQDDSYLRSKIENRCIHLNQSDANITLLMAKYMNRKPEFYVESMMGYLNHGFRPLYHLSHMRCFLVVNKQMHQQDGLVINTDIRGETYFKNLLLCLSTCSDEEIRTAFSEIDRTILNTRLEMWLDHYVYDSSRIMHYWDPNWADHWDKCTRVLFVLLGDHWSNLPAKYKEKRFGNHSLQYHYNQFELSNLNS